MPCVYLISTPCQFAHEFGSDHVCVTQLPYNLGDYRHLRESGPFEHHFYALQIETSATDRSFVRKLDLDLGDLVGLLSLWYGKRIRSHGPIYWDGAWCLPELLDVMPNPYCKLPIYSQLHTKPPTLECNWQRLSELSWLIEALAVSDTSVHPVVAAAKSYSEAVRLLPIDREVAYFRFVQALECVVSESRFSDEDKFSHDQQLTQALEWLESLSDPQGAKVGRLIRNRLYQTKRGVWLWLSSRIDSSFYVGESNSLTQDNLRAAISAAYDLRSRYVHAGVSFGDWIDPVDGRCESFEMVPPDFLEVCEDRVLRRMLGKCPTFVGMERLVRYALVKELQSRSPPSEA